MKNKLIKYSIIIVAYLLGTYLIQTYIPWDRDFMQGFFGNFFALSALFLAIGIFAGAKTFKLKKFNLKDNAHSLIIIAVSLLIIAYLSAAYFIMYANIPFATGMMTYNYITLNYMFLVDGGLIMVLPCIIGHNIASILFE
ncbi:MAG: hypothetical protein R3Y65_07230 [Bacillota bacterium]